MLIRNKITFVIVLVISTEADLKKSGQATALQGRQNAYPGGVCWLHLVPWSSFSFSPLWLELEVRTFSSYPYSRKEFHKQKHQDNNNETIHTGVKCTD